MHEAIKDRMLKFIEYKGVEKARFEKDAGLSNGFVDKIGDSMRSTSLDKIRKSQPKLNISWLLTGEGEMLLEGEGQSPAIPLSGNCQPILDIRVSAGHGNGLYGDEKQVVEWVNIPQFEGCCGIMVYGDSMYDKFKSGDIIFVRPIQGRNDFDFGQCYVVITNEDRYIKNVYESLQGKEYITMTSFNIEINPDGRRKYPDRDIHINDIKHLYKVAGKLRRDQL